MSLSYELAKKLKEVGFPQDVRWDTRHFPMKDGSVVNERKAAFIVVNDILENVISPSLSPLIEACGKKKDYGYAIFDLSMHGTGEGWVAGYSDPDYHETWEDYEEGSTPEEAVARLYIALHDKNKETKT